jgi:hypothetical protein
MEQSRNASQQPGFLLVFGFIFLPQEYEVERDVVVTLIGVMSLISAIFNAILLLVIIKDPFKQLRNITAILLAFNSAANFGCSLILLLYSVFFWSHRNLFPAELVVYLNSCAVSLYFIGNLLHTLNIYGTIVVPVRYIYLSSKVRKILVQFLGLIFVIIVCVIMIPAYALPKNKVFSYVEGTLTFVCVQLALLTVIFVYLYARIFQALYARKKRLFVSFNIERSTPRGMKIMKRDYEVAKTLFIHVLFFMLASVPLAILLMIVLYCTSCGDPTKLHLAILFTLPCVYTTFVFHPILWLSRLNSYKQAMKQTLSFSRRSQMTSQLNNNYNCSMTLEENKPRSGTVSSVTSF